MADNIKTAKGMELYNALASVPTEAKKTISGGRLDGFTDINPMWRIQKLTEVFGPCGIGWYTEVVDHWTSEGSDEISAHVRIKLYYRTEDGWSAPIEGIGGSKLVAQERRGAYHSDEAFKMAYTDAISVACKALGMAADIYFAKGVKTRDNLTKYDNTPVQEPERIAMDQDTYWKVIAAYAAGKTTKTGGSLREKVIQEYKATPAQIARFDADVDNYKASRQ